MGLPIFYYKVVERAASPPKECAKEDPCVSARSSIRRRPSIHRGRFPRPSQAWLSNHTHANPRSDDHTVERVSLPDERPLSRGHTSNTESGSRSVALDYLRARAAGTSDDRRRHRQLLRSRNEAQDTTASLTSVAEIYRRALLPTPPLETSEPPSVPANGVQQVDGLGDRVTSPSPPATGVDDWQIMRDTIRADSSFPSSTTSFPSTTATSTAQATTQAATPISDNDSIAPRHLRVPDSEMDCPPEYDSVSEHERLAQRTTARMDPAEDEHMQDESQDSFSDYDDELSALREEYCALQDSVSRLDTQMTERLASLAAARESSTSTTDRSEFTSQRAIVHSRGRYHPVDSVRPPSRPDPVEEPPSAAERTTSSDTTTPAAGSEELDLTMAQVQLRRAAFLLNSWRSELNANRPLDDAELQQMRGLLEMISRRQDVPDDMWASAGLLGNVGRTADDDAAHEGDETVLIPRPGGD